jgi:hypothetical protein
MSASATKDVLAGPAPDECLATNAIASASGALTIAWRDKQSCADPLRARLRRGSTAEQPPVRPAAHPLTAPAYRKTRPVEFAMNPRQTNTLGSDQIQATWSTLIQRPATPSRSRRRQPLDGGEPVAGTGWPG